MLITNLENLVTKADLEVAKNDILKWVLAFLVAQTGLLLTASRFLH